MNKNEVRYNNEMNLVKSGTVENIDKVMKMMYHDLGYRRKDSLLHTYDLLGVIAHYNTDNGTDFILNTAFPNYIYTKPNLIKEIRLRLDGCKKVLAKEKAERTARTYLTTVINKAINHINTNSKTDISDTLRFKQDRIYDTLKGLGSNYAIKYDTNRLHVLQHELTVLNTKDFNTTLYTFTPRNSISGYDPTLRKPTCNPKIEYPRLIKFDGLSKSKAHKIIKLRQFKAKLNVDFRPTTYKDLKHEFKEWFEYDF